MKNREKLAAILSVMLGFVIGIGGTNAYLTSFDQARNTIGVGQNTTTIEEEFPTPSPITGDGDSGFSKTVWIANGDAQKKEASVDCYVRVSLGYSDHDIGKAVTLKNLNQTDWVKAADGFYYYKKILREGETTVPLFSGVSVDSTKIEKTYLDRLDTFEIQVYEESVQAAGLKDYRSAWTFYGADTGTISTAG